MQFSGNAFLDGFAFPVTSNLPGGIKHVTWQGQFTSDTAGLAVNWQWAAAVYRRFGTDYNGLGVKPVDDNHLSNYQNADHAGSPEVYLPYVTGGATGGGGSNFTGSLSSTQQVTPDQSQINLSGYVMDTNGFAIEGAVLTLETTDSQGHTITYTASTDANGFYQFTNLIAGVYTETVTPPSPYYQPDSEQAGTVNGSTDGTDFGFGTLGNINLGAGNTGLNYNFILRQNQF
jgi:hypothetical protein